jgi:hypothetical protein
MGLQAKPPLRMIETVAQGELRVPGPCWIVERLQEKVVEVEVLEAFRLSAGLRENQLELVSSS